MRCGMAVDAADRFTTMHSWQAAAIEVFGDSTDSDITFAARRYGVDECPYQGLAAYQSQDADRFYGRDDLVRDLIERLRRHRVLVVGGASGSGKSSLVRAGLIPAIRSGALPNSSRWPSLLFTPGAEPLKELEYQLRKTLDSLHVGTPKSNATTTDDSRWRRMAEAITDVTGGVVIVIDQFEELFTFDRDRETLDDILTAFASMSDPSTSLVRFVFVIRADFYGSSSRFPWLADTITQNQVLVGPMSRVELLKAITEPARHANLRLEDNLVETVLEEVGSTAGTLPLVSHALAESWKLRTGNRLTLDNYRAAGGMFGAIGQSAETLLCETFNPVEQAAARRLLLRLVSPGQGIPDTRRPLALTDIQDASEGSATRRVMDALVEARLLTIDSNIVQLAHETIILSWPRLQDWINESRDDLRFQQRIERVATEWHESGRDPDLLYHGTPLLTSLEWLESNSESVNVLEKEFLDVSADAQEKARSREQAAAVRTRRNRRLAFSALTLLLIASLISSLFAFNAFRRARNNEMTANFRLAQSLASQAADLVDRNPRLALALAAEVMEREASASVDARIALVNSAAAMEAAPYTPFAGFAVGDAITVAVHPTYDLLLTGNRDGTVEFWNSSGVSLGEPIKAHGSAIEEFAFSPDGKRLLSAGLDGAIMTWDIVDASTVPTPKLAIDITGLAWSVAFSPDGSMIAIAAEDGTVRLFDAITYEETHALIDIERDFLSVQFSPNSELLLAGNGRGQIQGWRTSDGESVIKPFLAHESDVWEILFYPDGTRFVTASSDGRVRIWDLESLTMIVEPFADIARDIRGIQIDGDDLLIAGDEKGRLLFWDTVETSYLGASVAHHDSKLLDAAAQRTSSLMVSLGMDQVVRTWRGLEQASFHLFDHHEHGAYGLSLSGNSKLLATGDGAGRVRIFELPGGEAAGVPLKLSDERIWAVALDATGEFVAAGDQQGRVALWDVESGRRLARVDTAHEGSVTALAFHPTESLLISGGADGVVRQWRVGSLARVDADMQGHVGGVMRFSLSSDGSSLAAADRTGGLRIWDVATAHMAKEWQADDNTIWSVVWSPEDDVLATAHADEVVKLWDVDTATVLKDLTPHPGGATDVAFLSDGVTLVSTSRNGTVRLWDTELGLRLGEALDVPGKPVWRLIGSPQNDWFATSNANGDVKAWYVLNRDRICRQAAWDVEAQRRYLGVGEAPMACRE